VALPANWQAQLLRGIRAPVTPQNVRFLNEWHLREGGGDKNNANFNPLNTTQGAPGAGSINSVGVKSYRSGQQGISATVATLLNGHYGDIVGGLRSGRATAAQLANSPSLSVWGTGRWGSGSAPQSRSATLARAITPSAPASPQTGAQSLGKQAITAYLLQSSNALAAGQQVDPNSVLQLAMLRQQMGPGQQVSTLQNGNVSLPVIHGKIDGHTSQALDFVKHAIGTPYVWGGARPGGFDCSGLLQYAWGRAGVKIPRTTYDQWRKGTAIARGQLRPGDAVFFRGSDARGNLPGHVGMYIGGGKFIEAPHTGANVRISTLAGRSDYQGARRY